MGHPCRIQRGLARRLCILLACTDPLSTLAPQTSISDTGSDTGPEGPELESQHTDKKFKATHVMTQALYILSLPEGGWI